MAAARTSTSPAPDQCRCRCSLPGLTGFTADRREDADADCQGIDAPCHYIPVTQPSQCVPALALGRIDCTLSAVDKDTRLTL